MGEVTEKIYCCDRPSDNSAMWAALMNKGNNCGEMAALMNGGMNGWMNNPFAYLMFLALFRNGGLGVDGNGYGNGHVASTHGIEMQAQLNAIRTQMQDNQNADCIKQAIGDGFTRNDFALSQLAQYLNIDFDTLQRCCCDVQAAIQQVAGQVGFSAERVINAANMGDCNIIQSLKDCCCQTQRQIADFRADMQLQTCQQTAELRNGQRDLGVALSQGFSATAYETQKQTCEVINAGKDNTQRIIDTLNNHWSSELQLKYQDAKAELSQSQQTNALTAQLTAIAAAIARIPTTAPATTA